MEDLRKWHLRPLPNENFVLDGYDGVGFHLERELRFEEMQIPQLHQDYIQIRFKNSKKEYRLWWKDINFSRPSVPLYIRGDKLHSRYFHAIYAVIAEVSYYACGFSKEINREYLKNTHELAKFYVNRDLEAMIKTMLKAAGVEEGSS